MQVCKTPVHRPITQLSVSPSGDYIALLTSHTCHVCILTSSARLNQDDGPPEPLRLKSFQVGPTAHVLEQSPLASAIWHPLSPTGNTLVTMAQDACVRLWDLDSDNRYSFDEPNLAIDLKKLANATSSKADLSTSRYGTSRGYSLDQVEMEVAAACFGGQGQDDEHGWASMTLWIAMTEGDVYALCPFLPSKWAAPGGLLPSLSTAVMEKSMAVTADPESSDLERRTIDQQCKWLKDVDSQDPLLMAGIGASDTVEVYSRPDRPSAIPRLQGPLQLTPMPELGEVTDIHVVAPKIDSSALYDDSDSLRAEDEENELSVSIICLATTTNEVHICLDIDGIEASWLPSKRTATTAFEENQPDRDLIVLETVDLDPSEHRSVDLDPSEHPSVAHHEVNNDDGWPTFTPSPLNRYGVFVTHPMGVSSLNFEYLARSLEQELASASQRGVALRLSASLEATATMADQPIEVFGDPEKCMSSAVIFADSPAWVLILTAAKNTPLATILDCASPLANPYAPDSPCAQAALEAPEPRAPYRPAPLFDLSSSLARLRTPESLRTASGGDLKAQVRFSPATLELITKAHSTISTETFHLGRSTAELFRRCEWMRAELREQLRKVSDVLARLDVLTGADDPQADGPVGTAKLEARLQYTRAKNLQLHERVQRMGQRMRLLGGKELSAKEKAFAEEIRMLLRLMPGLDPDGAPPDLSTLSLSAGDGAGSGRGRRGLTSRFDALQRLERRLVGEADVAFDALQKQPHDSDARLGASRGPGAAQQQQRLQRVMGLLERESALVEAVTQRLARLQRGV